MKVEQLYTGCLAEAAYYIESEGEAAIIDPLREPEPYLKMAAENNSKIKYIFETHFHADFVSGHLDLANKTGAKIVFGPNAKPTYEMHEATDGEEFKIGKVTIKVLHTPGHTLESTTYLLLDEDGKEHCIFSGDTLFIGDVGRPDLAVKSDLSQNDLAGLLFESLRNKIMPLPDHITVYPAHGAGSACGKNMSSETFDSLGSQKKTNYALRADMTKAEFVKEVTTGLAQPPRYFPMNVALNKNGYESLDSVRETASNPLLVADFKNACKAVDPIILDTRDPQDWAKGFIPNSLNIGLGGSFAPWVGALIHDSSRPILLVGNPGDEEEAVTRLARVGYDNVMGYLKGGVSAWKQAGEAMGTVESIPATELETRMANKTLYILDVRNRSEWEAEHVNGSQNVALGELEEKISEVKKDQPIYVHCRSGYRSMVASSILKQHGFEQVIDIDGGMKAIGETQIPLSEFVCPSTLTK